MARKSMRVRPMGEVEAAADLEGQLLSLQEEFVRLQEGAAEVESCLGRKVAELEVTLVHLQQQNDQLTADKADLQTRLVEKEQEIRYLQSELELSMERKPPTPPPPTLPMTALGAATGLREAQEMFATIANIRASLERISSHLAPSEP